MIITLIGADFSSANVGTLTTWRVTTSLGKGATYNGPTSVERDPVQSLSATVTIDEGYTVNIDNVSILMGNVAQTGAASINGNTITITLAAVTGNVTIKVPTINSSTGEEDDGGNDSVGYIALPTTKYALGVTSTGTGRVSANNAKRFSTADDTVANGILIPNGKTLHLIGLASGTYPLRLDYIYCTGNVTCPPSGSTTAIEGLVGTASNYVSTNYFPLNTAGADAIDITNNYGADYYFWFGFAGQTLNESILTEYDTYTLKYKID